MKYKTNLLGKPTDKIEDEVSIGDNYLHNLASGTKSNYEFKDFGDQAIAIWRFLAKGSSYEWVNTEYKIGTTVYSVITSSNSEMSAYIPTRMYEAENLVYWISVHNHTNGVNGLSANGPNGQDDKTRLGDFRRVYPNAQMNAYSFPYLKDALEFFQTNRK